MSLDLKFQKLARTLVDRRFGGDAVLVRSSAATFDPVTDAMVSAGAVNMTCRAVYKTVKTMSNDGRLILTSGALIASVEPRVGDRLVIGSRETRIDSVSAISPAGEATIIYEVLVSA